MSNELSFGPLASLMQKYLHPKFSLIIEKLTTYMNIFKKEEYSINISFCLTKSLFLY